MIGDTVELLMNNSVSTFVQPSKADASVPVIYTRAQVASMLDVTEDTVRRWVREGRLRATRLTKRTVRISHVELERFIAIRTK